MKQMSATAMLDINKVYIGWIIVDINSPKSQVDETPQVYSTGKGTPFIFLLIIGKNNIKTNVRAAKKNQIDCILFSIVLA